MPTISAQTNFTVENDPVCWAGALSHFELKLLQPLPLYALEQLRIRFLHFLTTNHDPRLSARRTYQMAFETEIGVAINKVVSILPDQAAAIVCPARRFLDIDSDMAPFSFLYNPALDSIEENGFLPLSYVNLFRVHFASPYARYRMCAIAALLCLAAQYLVPEQIIHTTLAFADSVTAQDSRVATPGLVLTESDTVAVVDNRTVVVA